MYIFGKIKNGYLKKKKSFLQITKENRVNTKWTNSYTDQL